MSHDRDRFQELLEGALEREPEARVRYLLEACPEDPELRTAVERALAAEAESGPFDRLFEVFGADAPGHGEEGTAAGSRLGPFRIERLLGRGGMGSVFLARRVDGQFDQTVAIKILRADATGEEPQRHFLAERQILARLSHPNIARLFGGGVTAADRPYLVMEFVDGTPLDRYCDERRLDVSERLRLFLTVCDAVDHAHRHLVVHRDIKPGNIVVSDSGQVKLLDFGIAKLLDPDAFGQSGPSTRADLRLMTPEYASPEQVRGEPITTASDVYQLGVLLYELLAGRRPFSATGSLREWERAVCEDHPPRASAAVAGEDSRLKVGPVSLGVPSAARRSTGGGRTTGAGTTEVAAARSSTPQRLRRRLRGDLDNIVSKALRKQPSDRYSSIGALAADVRRHLEGLPVEARAPTVRYRLVRFVARHRAGVAFSAVLLLALVALAAISLRFAVVTAAQSRAVEREAARATQVTGFLLGLFEQSDPDRSAGDSLSARDLLDQGVERAEALSDRALRADMLAVIGRVFSKLGDYEQAGDLFRRAIGIQRGLGPDMRADLALNLADLGEVLWLRGDFDAARSTMMESLSLRRSLGDPGGTAANLNDLGRLAQDMSDFEGAEAYHREALQLRRRTLGEDSEEVSYSLVNLGKTVRDLGRLDEAESLFREALAIQERRLGADHTETLWTRVQLGRLLADTGRLDEAEPVLLEAARASRQRFGERHPLTAYALGELGKLFFDLGEYGKAETAYRDALAIRRAAFGPGHMYVAVNLNNLASVLLAGGRAAVAEPLVREALNISREALGDENVPTALFTANLGNALLQLGRRSEAEQRFRESLARLRWLLPPEHPHISRPLLGLGELLTLTARAEEARPLLEEALAIRRDAYGQDHWNVFEAESALGDCLFALGLAAEAEPLLLHGLEGLRARKRADDPTTRKASARLVRLYESRGDFALAARYR
ncbi:MAG: serine/threonine-protein kinase [Gemmatimonadota bacterium]|nr:serine/threonine-protein kinase [Gemmatimonadota bacterium]